MVQNATMYSGVNKKDSKASKAKQDSGLNQEDESTDSVTSWNDRLEEIQRRTISGASKVRLNISF
jgi:hypothetical protein